MLSENRPFLLTVFYEMFKAVYPQVRMNPCYMLFNTHLLDHTVHVAASSFQWREPGDQHLQK